MKAPLSTRQTGLLSFSLIIGILLIDQLLKVWIKTTLCLGEHICIADDWAYLLFTENDGMAFGWDFASTWLLASFRLVAVAALIYYVYKTIKQRKPLGFIICLSLILAGAAGNIFDNAFYGLLFSESTRWSVAEFIPFGEGYTSFLNGRVVDMFYFPLIDTYLPYWFPIGAGTHFVFFSPIFNFSDAAISCGGVAILLFYRKLLVTTNKEK